MAINWNSPNAPQAIFEAALTLANRKIGHANQMFDQAKKPLSAAAGLPAALQPSAVSADQFKQDADALFQSWGGVMPEGAVGALATLVSQAEQFMGFFFGPMSDYQNKVNQLLTLLSSPASALQSVGNRNVARAAMDGIFNAEGSRFLAHTQELAEYVLPAGALASISSGAANRQSQLHRVAGATMERKFLDFDRGANDDMVSVRLDAARTLLGEPGAAFTSIKEFIEGAAVTIFSRGAKVAEDRGELTARLIRLYSEKMGEQARESMLAQQFRNASKEVDQENWRATAGFGEADHARLAGAFAACSQNIVLQLSAIMNMMRADSSLSSNYTQTIKLS